MKIDWNLPTCIRCGRAVWKVRDRVVHRYSGSPRCDPDAVDGAELKLTPEDGQRVAAG